MTIQPEPANEREARSEDDLRQDDVQTELPFEDQVPEAPSEPAFDFVAAERGRTLGRARNWMAWIAALSIVNIVATVSGSDFSFAIGLVFSQMCAIFGSVLAEDTNAPAIAWAAGAIGAVPALAYAGLWYLAKPERTWVWGIATIVFVLDLFLLAIVMGAFGAIEPTSLVIQVGIRLWAIWALSNGYWTARRMKTGA